MKKCFFLFFIIPFFWSCKKASKNECTYKESTLVATSAETSFLDSVLSAGSITAIAHPSGVFYTIDSLGSGSTSGSLCSNLTVKYKGFLLGNTKAFDSTREGTTVVLELGSLVVGWQKVLPLIKTGSKVTLYIPPTLGYGAQQQLNGDGDITIPSYSYLKFNIELINVQ